MLVRVHPHVNKYVFFYNKKNTFQSNKFVLDPNVDVMSPRQAELARTPLLQASLADRRTVALGDDAGNVVEASFYIFI